MITEAAITKTASVYTKRLREATHPLAIVFVICLVVCLLCDFSLARSQGTNADLLQNYNELLSVRAGNPLLKGWTITSDNFYFTDLSFFVLVSFIIGPSIALVYIAPFFIFCTLLFARLTLVYRTTQDQAAKYAGLFAILFLIGLPFGPQVNVLLQPAIHSGTIALVMCAIVFIQPMLAEKTFNKFMLIPFGMLVFAVEVSDPLSTIFLAAPLAILVLLRLWLKNKFSLPDCLLFGVTAAAVGGAFLFLSILAHNGGFKTSQSFTTDLVPTAAGLLFDIHAAVAALRNLFTSRYAVLGHTPFKFLVAVSRSLFLCVIVFFAARIVWRIPRDSKGAGAQMMILGAAVLITLSVFNSMFFNTISLGVDFPGAPARYITPAYIFLSTTSVLEFQSLVAEVRYKAWRKIIFGSLALASIPFLAAGVSIASTRALKPRPEYSRAPTFALASLLKAKGFHYGIGDYWTVLPLISFTGGAIQTVPVTGRSGRLLLFRYNSDATPWAKMSPPEFVAFDPSNMYGVSVATAEKTFGLPVRIDDFGGFT